MTLATPAPVYETRDYRAYHITATTLTDEAWSVAVAVGARFTSLCGLEAAPRAAPDVDAPACPTCRLLASAYDLEMR